MSTEQLVTNTERHVCFFGLSQTEANVPKYSFALNISTVRTLIFPASLPSPEFGLYSSILLQDKNGLFELKLFILDLKLIYTFDPGASLLEIILKH